MIRFKVTPYSQVHNKRACTFVFSVPEMPRGTFIQYIQMYYAMRHFIFEHVKILDYFQEALSFFYVPESKFV